MSTSEDMNDQQSELPQIIPTLHTNWCSTVLKKEYTRNAKNIEVVNNTLAKSAGGNPITGFGKPLIQTSSGASLYKAPVGSTLDFLAKLKQNFAARLLL
jgi:hypothetical protein